MSDYTPRFPTEPKPWPNGATVWRHPDFGTHREDGPAIINPADGVGLFPKEHYVLFGVPTTWAEVTRYRAHDKTKLFEFAMPNEMRVIVASDGKLWVLPEGRRRAERHQERIDRNEPEPEEEG